jgi:hypothetical protein
MDRQVDVKGNIMEATNLEIMVTFLIVLSFGSSLIHYSAFAKVRAKANLSEK